MRNNLHYSMLVEHLDGLSDNEKPWELRMYTESQSIQGLAESLGLSVSRVDALSKEEYIKHKFYRCWWMGLPENVQKSLQAYLKLDSRFSRVYRDWLADDMVGMSKKQQYSFGMSVEDMSVPFLLDCEYFELRGKHLPSMPDIKHACDMVLQAYLSPPSVTPTDMHKVIVLPVSADVGNVILESEGVPFGSGWYQDGTITAQMIEDTVRGLILDDKDIVIHDTQTITQNINPEVCINLHYVVVELGAVAFIPVSSHKQRFELCSEVIFKVLDTAGVGC